jgi:integrase
MPQTVRVYVPDQPVPAAGRIVREVVDFYLSSTAVNYAPRALTERQRDLEIFCASFGQMLVSDCRPYHLVAWFNSHPEWKSPWTKRAKNSIIQRVFHWAAKRKYIDANPFENVQYEEGDPRRPVTDPEFRRMLRASDALFRRYLFFLRCVGCRPGEADELLWPEVELIGGYAIKEKHKTRKKTKKPRIIPLPSVIVRMLLWMRSQCDGNGHVFRNTKGHPWNRSNRAIRMRGIRRRAKIPADAFIHGVRHAVGSACIREGASLKLVSQAMGHSSTAITEKFYVDVRSEVDAMRKALDLGKLR